MKNSAAGSRAELLASTDDRFIATTPAGDVLVRERLIPTDNRQAVQRLPPMELDAPLVRIIGETGVVMSRLKPSAGPALNGTFVFVRQQSAWRLVAMHLSPVGR
ncbi:MAG: nuclear transport factor 2 family protein [Acidobacteria bacterium]|nr:nuclear transport factor 2 family protein [Acidobacteriota bacterium]